MNTKENKKKIWNTRNKYIYRKSASFSYYQSQAIDGLDLTSIRLNKFSSLGGDGTLWQSSEACGPSSE